MSPCPSCGKPRNANARFCATCGLAVVPVGSAAPTGALLDALRPTAESTPLEHPGGLAPGTIIDNKYVVSRVLGEGGMGIVYLARDRNIGVDVVLKAVRAELAHRADVRERTLSEGQALARIDHPNVVRFNAVIVEGPSLWLVMQYIEGESLEARLERLNHEGRRMPLAEALSIFKQVVEGVAAAHREGLIHRDLKPGNVLLRAKDGVAKVSDFGIAKTQGDALEGKGVTRGIIGSLYYMSPEQVLGRRDLDKRVDLYALGILLYEMLIGRVPFDAESEFELMRLQAEAPMPLIATQRADIPPTLDALVGTLTEKDRDRRFGSCEALLAALATFESATPAPGAVAAGRGHTVMTPAPPFASAAPHTFRAANTTTGGQALSHTPLPYPEVHPFAHAEPPPHARGPSEVIPPTQTRSRRGLAIGLGSMAVAGAVGFFVFNSDFAEQPSSASPNGTSRPASSASAQPSAESTARAGSDGNSTEALKKLVGAWRTVDTKRDLDAVLVDATVEFRVVDAAQFEANSYRAGDVRFRLAVSRDNPGMFAVIDQPRVVPPTDYTIGNEAWPTCVATIEAVNGAPLKARVAGETLEVEFANFVPKMSNFTLQARRITSCVGLDALPISRLPAIRLMRR